MKCQAKSKRSQEPCKKDPMKGSRFCHMHGGKSLKGVANPNFKHGRYSGDLVANLQDGYMAELTDPELIELRDEIAAARSYIKEIMREGESGVRWREIREAVREVRRAIREKDAPAIMPAVEEANRIAALGTRDWAHRAELMQRFEGVRRLTDSEHKHRIDNRLAISQEQLMVTIAAVVDIIKGHVEKEQLRAIDAELGQLITGLSGGFSGDPQAN